VLFPVLFKEPLQITILLKTVCIKRCVVLLQEELKSVIDDKTENSAHKTSRRVGCVLLRNSSPISTEWK